MKVVSLHQPWASLCVTRQPCDCRPYSFMSDLPHSTHCPAVSMVKRFETRSWPCPPALIGERIAFHATRRKPKDFARIGDYEMVELANGDVVMVRGAARFDRSQHVPLPLGAIVGSGRITASYLIVADPEMRAGAFAIATVHGDVHVMTADSHHVEYPGQTPYGDFTPGRYAWLIEDAASTQARCPWCWGTGCDDDGCAGGWVGHHHNCPVCDGAGHCDPIPARGAQRIWRWTP